MTNKGAPLPSEAPFFLDKDMKRLKEPPSLSFMFFMGKETFYQRPTTYTSPRMWLSGSIPSPTRMPVEALLPI